MINKLGCGGWMQFRRNVSHFFRAQVSHKPGSRGQSRTIRTIWGKEGLGLDLDLFSCLQLGHSKTFWEKNGQMYYVLWFSPYGDSLLSHGCWALEGQHSGPEEILNNFFMLVMNRLHSAAKPYQQRAFYQAGLGLSSSPSSLFQLATRPGWLWRILEWD